MSPYRSALSRFFDSAPRNNDISIKAEEYATLMYRDIPLIRLHFKKGVLVGKENLGKTGLIFVDFFLDLPLHQLSEVLFNRVFPLGRPNRSEVYFKGMNLTTFQELKMYRGADRDDFCWLKFDGDDVTWEEVFYG